MLVRDAVAAPPEPVGVEDLDPAGLLAAVAAAEARVRAAEVDRLRLGYQWCVTHPATGESGTASWGGSTLPGVAGESLGGEGTPAVAGHAAEPFAAALGMSTQAGMGLLADALDLVHRLPRLWAEVESLRVPAWQARRVARATHGLSRAAAGFVDARVATRVGRSPWARVEEAIAHAVAVYHPDRVAERERDGRQGWDVTLYPVPGSSFDATSELLARGDALDLAGFHDLVCEEAARLAALGDTDPLGARKAKALGVIADRHPTLPLPVEEPTDPATADPGPDAETASGRAEQSAACDPGARPGAAGPVDRPVGAVPVAVPVGFRRRRTVRVYLHLSLVDLLGLGGEDPVGWADRLGPVTADRIRAWVGHDRVRITPVLDPARTGGGVDRHDPPEWMREQVVLRDPTCVFPWCGRDARWCDLDHIHPYDDDGPPGQTRPGNLAPLCRRHHRAKTHAGWAYRRNRHGHYRWTSPHGHGYTVTPTGTTPDDPNDTG